MKCESCDAEAVVIASLIPRWTGSVPIKHPVCFRHWRDMDAKFTDINDKKVFRAEKIKGGNALDQLP